MNTLFRDAKRFLRNRFSGEYNAIITSMTKHLENLDELQANTSTNFWVKWYVNSYRSRLDILKKSRFSPAALKISSMYEDALKEISNNNRVELIDIVLPLPANESISIYIAGLLDSLSSYLLDGVDDELYYALCDSLPEGPYEYKEVKLIKGDIVIDAGANVGEFSALVSVRGGQAYAFEPIKNTIDAYLSKTAEWNSNITICPYAISDKSEEVLFDEDFTGSTFVMTRKGAKKVKVQAIDLDTFAEQNNLPRIDFIKADIEGAERYMLMGAKRVLKEFAPKIAICTYHLPDDPQVLRQLILDANPNYVIEERWKKMYAHVPKTS